MSKFAIATLFGVVAIIMADLTVISLEHAALWVSYMFAFMAVSACVGSWVYPFLIKEANNG